MGELRCVSASSEALLNEDPLLGSVDTSPTLRRESLGFKLISEGDSETNTQRLLRHRPIPHSQDYSTNTADISGLVS